jgi:hypothetical protein
VNDELQVVRMGYGTHMSQFHGEWNRNQSTFYIPATHVFWGKLGTTPYMEKGPVLAGNTSIASSGVSRGQLSELIDWYKTEDDDGAFASFLSEFEGLLNKRGIASLIGVSMSF